VTFVCVEHKSSGEDISAGSTYWRRLTLDPQCSLYLQACAHLGYPADTVNYDVLSKPKQQPFTATPVELRKYTVPTKKEPISRLYANQRETDETSEEFEARVLGEIARAPEAFYQRGTIVRLEAEAIDADFDVWQTAENIRESKKYNVWPRNPDSCIQWSRACPYLDICCGQASADDPSRYRRQERMHEELSEETHLDGKVHLTLLTQSSIRTYRSCARKYKLRYEERLRSTERTPGPLRVGTSLHKMLEVWWGNGGNLTMALAANETTDPFDRAKERAIMIGYHARWPAPTGVVGVEKEFRMTLVNPSTGHPSRTFELGGKLDVILEA
jgi:hypothetical protein